MGTVIILTALFFLTPELMADDQLPRWEVGIGGGAASIPQHMGSDERYALAIPIPYLIYRGK